jgi:hypothetical protein
MTDQHQAPIGTVAEEAARLVAAMATMARSSADPGPDPSPYAGPEDAPPGDASSAGASSAGAPSAGASSAGARSTGACSACGGDSDGTPVACKLCPLCQGIALLRSVRPETVDRLADLASALAAGLRDMATQSRASGPTSDAGPSSARPSDRATVQDIRVDDEDER